MNKVIFAVALVALLLSITFTVALAGVGMEDPALCVDGHWLVVNAASQTGVKIVVPKGTAYGDQTAGGCAEGMPTGVTLLYDDHVVKTKAASSQLFVEIDAKRASEPSITASYDYSAQSDTQSNTGKGWLYFVFDLP